MKESFAKKEEAIEKILEEIRINHKISPLRNIKDLTSNLLEGIYDIETFVGSYIDFDEDLTARKLLKDYVLFSDFNMISKFKEEYYSEYVSLQIKYNCDTVLQ